VCGRDDKKFIVQDGTPFLVMEYAPERLPDALSTLLAATIEAWDAGQPDSARAHLQQAAALAREKGYL